MTTDCRDCGLPTERRSSRCEGCAKRRAAKSHAAALERYRAKLHGEPDRKLVHPCQGVTATGRPCFQPAVEGSRFCRWGDRPWHRGE